MCNSDRETIEQCLNGHPETYRQLVRRYQGSLLSFLAAKLGSVEEEAGRETFVRAYFALGTVTKNLSRAYAMLRESLPGLDRRHAEKKEVKS